MKYSTLMIPLILPVLVSLSSVYAAGPVAGKVRGGVLQPMITVTNPAAGQEWTKGKTYTISWLTPITDQNVKLNLRRPTGGGRSTWVGLIKKDIPAQQKNLAWKVGVLENGAAVPPGDYIIRAATMDNETKGETDPFNIVPAILMRQQGSKNLTYLNVIKKVRIDPHISSIDFKITAFADAILKLRIHRAPVPTGSECDETLPVEIATFALGWKKEWKAKALDLRQDWPYTWEVCAKDKKGEEFRSSGMVRTLGRKIKVTFEEVEIIDDGDNLSEGEFMFRFWVHNKGPVEWPTDRRSTDIGTGSTKQINTVVTVEGVPETIQIKVQGADYDPPHGESIPVPGIPFCAIDFGSTCWEDWGEVKKTVDVSVGGSQEFEWNATSHGVDFVIHGKIEVIE